MLPNAGEVLQFSVISSPEIFVCFLYACRGYRTSVLMSLPLEKSQLKTTAPPPAAPGRNKEAMAFLMQHGKKWKLGKFFSGLCYLYFAFYLCLSLKTHRHLNFGCLFFLYLNLWIYECCDSFQVLKLAEFIFQNKSWLIPSWKCYYSRGKDPVTWGEEKRVEK